MAHRQVFTTKKNDDGDILALCNSTETWSPRYKKEAITDIESGKHSYFVVISGIKVNIRVVTDPVKGKYLRTDPDQTNRNNLDMLPDC